MCVSALWVHDDISYSDTVLHGFYLISCMSSPPLHYPFFHTRNPDYMGFILLYTCTHLRITVVYSTIINSIYWKQFKKLFYLCYLYYSCIFFVIVLYQDRILSRLLHYINHNVLFLTPHWILVLQVSVDAHYPSLHQFVLVLLAVWNLSSCRFFKKGS